MAEMRIGGDTYYFSVKGFKVLDAIAESDDLGGADKSAEEIYHS